MVKRGWRRNIPNTVVRLIIILSFESTVMILCYPRGSTGIQMVRGTVTKPLSGDRQPRR